MRIKRYFAKNIREAIKKVRQEQGPDAVILSNRNVEGGVELVAAVDFEEVLFCDDALVVNTTQPASAAKPAPQQPLPQTPAARPGIEINSTSKATAPIMQEKAPDKPLTRAAINDKAATRNGQMAQTKTKTKNRIAMPGNDLVMAEMRREMKNMRGMLEQQLNGVMWGDNLRRNPHQAKLLHKLLRLELSPKLCQQIIGDLAKARSPDYTLRSALGVLAHKLPVTDDEILVNGGVIALLGPTGVGKTTTIAKLAARFAVRHGSRTVALITTDNYRVGAHEQLRAYAKILDIPLRVATNRPDLRSAIKDFSDRKLVLIDTAGMSQRDIRLSEQFALIKSGSSMIKPYLVLSATTRLPGLIETTKAFSRLAPKGCIITKIDEVDNLGGILNILIRHQLPAAYISDGQRVPEDLYVARAHNLISRSVALVKNASRDMDYSAMPLAVAFN